VNIELASVDPVNPLPGSCWVDSHVHFDAFDRAGLAERILDRAATAGVGRCIAIGGSDEANERAVRLAVEHPDRVGAVVGYDRDLAAAGVTPEPVAALIRDHAAQVVGIGESGLDYHYEPDTRDAQRTLFAAMLDLAAATTRPVVVHSRDADADTLDLLRAYVRNWPGDPGRPGVLHCFTGSYDFARKLLDLGLMISFSGIVTFRNADDLRDVARRLPLDRLLIETDAPYLAPPPYRGKTNEPAWVVRVAETLATLRGDALQTIAEQTTANAARLFAPTKESAT
jgi:TatD DNase family protein